MRMVSEAKPKAKTMKLELFFWLQAEGAKT
jgi:hypothetical protein